MSTIVGRSVAARSARSHSSCVSGTRISTSFCSIVWSTTKCQPRVVERVVERPASLPEAVQIVAVHVDESWLPATFTSGAAAPPQDRLALAVAREVGLARLVLDVVAQVDDEVRVAPRRSSRRTKARVRSPAEVRQLAELARRQRACGPKCRSVTMPIVKPSAMRASRRIQSSACALGLWYSSWSHARPS